MKIMYDPLVSPHEARLWADTLEESVKTVEAYADKCKVGGCSWVELQMTPEDVERMMQLHVSVAHKDTRTIP